MCVCFDVHVAPAAFCFYDLSLLACKEWRSMMQVLLKVLALSCGCENRFGSHFGVGAPPNVEPILVGIGMFTGGTGL